MTFDAILVLHVGLLYCMFVSLKSFVSHHTPSSFYCHILLLLNIAMKIIPIKVRIMLKSNGKRLTFRSIFLTTCVEVLCLTRKKNMAHLIRLALRMFYEDIRLSVQRKQILAKST